MRKKDIILLLLGTTVLVGIGLFFLNQFSPKKSAVDLDAKANSVTTINPSFNEDALRTLRQQTDFSSNITQDGLGVSNPLTGR